MARRFLSPEEVLKRVLDEHDNEVDDLDEINNLESTSKSDEDEFLPSTAIVDEAGIDNDVVCEEGSSELQDNLNESFEQAHKKRKVLPRGRLVKDIESSLDENNYDEYQVPETKEVFSAYLEQPKKQKRSRYDHSVDQPAPKHERTPK